MTADHVWLLARERGASIAHVPADQRAVYDQLDALLASLPACTPRPGWQRRLLDALDCADATRARAPGWLRRLRALLQRRWLPALTAIAAAALAVVVIRPPPRDPAPAPGWPEPRVTTAIRPGPAAHRARPGPEGIAVLGDTLIVDAILPPGATGELRAYNDAGEPLGRCAPGAACASRRDGALHLQLELTAHDLGDIRTLLFGPGLPARPDSLDRDLTVAQSGHISARQVAVFRVQ